MSTPAPPAHRISLVAATAIVVATMVGTGVFVSLGFQIGGMSDPGQPARGFPILMLWVVGGLVALCGALSYAEFTAMMPRSGGEYHLLGRGYHPLVGFLAGWISIIAGFSAPIAVTALAFGKYVNHLFPNVTVGAAAYGLVALLALLQMGGVKLVAKFQVSLTILKVLLILGFMVGAFLIGQHALNMGVLSPKAGDGSLLVSHKFAMSLFWVMYSYAGWNGAVYVAGDMEKPQRNLPIALLLGTLVVMFLYVGVNAVFMVGADWEGMRNQPDVGMVAAQSIFGMRGGWIMGALIAFGLLSTANAIFWTGAATLRVIGQDMRALRWLDFTDRRGEPMGAIWFMTALVLGGLLIGSMEALLNYIQALLQLCSLLVVVAVIWWRFRHPEMARPFRVPLYPVPPIIFIVVSVWILWVMVHDRGDVALWCAGTLVVGTVIYFLSKPAAGSSSPVVPAVGSTES